MKVDSYALVARVFPGLLSAIPFFVLHFFYLREVLGQFLGAILAVRVASDVSISLAFLFLLIQTNRFVSKEVFEAAAFGELHLPTTRYLLHRDNHLTREYKKNLHRRILRDFGIAIPNESDEIKDEQRSRKLADEAVSHIRSAVGNGRLVGQHNAEYGFWRNLSGGSVIALLFSAINLVLFRYHTYGQTPFWLSVVLVLFYVLHLCFAKALIVSHGESYAKVLIQEYMASA